MRKNIFSVIVLALLVSSCYEDIGNYDYSDTEKITIEGIETSYDRISAVESIQINPTVTSTDPNANFDYFWAIYETSVQGYAPKLDTIAHTKALDYAVIQEAKKWVLVFGAVNKNTGLTETVTADLNVSTAFTTGWFVLKDDGSDSDIDQLLTPDTIVPTITGTDVFSSINGYKLPGKARLLSFISSYKSFVANPSVATNTRTLVAVSEQDISFTYLNTMKEIRGFDEFSYEIPEKRDVNFFGYSPGQASYYTINDGQLYNIYNMSANAGTFGLPATKNTSTDTYHLSDYAAVGMYVNLYFDEQSSSFITHLMGSSTLTQVGDAAVTDMSAKDTNKDLMYLGVTAPYGKMPHIAVLRDKTNTNQVIVATITGSYSKLSFANDTVEATSKLINATRITTNQDEQLIYFVNGNQVWSRNLANGYEQKQFEAPAGEEITLLRHRKYTTASDAKYIHNYVIIGTADSSGNYKLRFFRKSAGNLNPESDFTVTGEGRAKDILFISPKVSEYTYGYGY